MADLYLTPTRIELMQAIDRGEVWQSYEGECPAILEDDNGQRKVTSRVDELSRAGYVREVARDAAWVLTEKGKAALAKAVAQKETSR